MRARVVHAGLLASTLAFAAFSSAADVSPLIDVAPALAAEEPAPRRGAPVTGEKTTETPGPLTRVVVVDVSTLPKGDLPRLPAETDAPTGVPAFTQPKTIALQSVAEITRPRRPRKKSIFTPMKKPIAKRTEKVKFVSLTASTPTIDAFYSPAPDATELDGPSSQRMSCTDQASVVPMRWESLATTPDGDVRLDTRDLWFDSKSCAVGPGPEASVTLKAIAWEDGKPWLFAMQSRSGITLIMPRVSDLSSESMVGAPIAMRGDFTRITLPLGRYGSGSIAAQVDSLGLSQSDDHAGPVEVGIELVKTMSERAPTLLVRTRRPPPEPEARD
jgi:hypothetical protein